MNVFFGIIFLTSLTVRYGLSTEEVYVAESKNSPNEFYEQKFNESIECLRRHLYVGIPQLEIPACDPLVFDHTVHLNIRNNQILQTDLKLDNLIIRGLLDFDVDSLRLTSDLVKTTNYHFKNIKITSLHKGYMNLLGLMGVGADGELDLKVADMNVTTVIKYNIEPPLIGDYKVIFNVGSVDLNMTGLQSDEGISETVSKFISYFAPQVINHFHKEVTEELSPRFEKKLSSYLSHLSFLDFLERVVNLDCKIKLYRINF